MAALEVVTGTTLDFDAAKILSRNRYRAASATPKDRIKTSEEEVAITGAGKADENVVRLEDVMIIRRVNEDNTSQTLGGDTTLVNEKEMIVVLFQQRRGHSRTRVIYGHYLASITCQTTYFGCFSVMNVIHIYDTREERQIDL